MYSKEEKEELKKLISEKKENDYEIISAEQGQKKGWIFSAVFTVILFAIQGILGEGFNFGLYAVLLAMLSPALWVKSKALKDKDLHAMAIMSTIGLIIVTMLHLVTLIKNCNYF